MQPNVRPNRRWGTDLFFAVDFTAFSAATWGMAVDGIEGMAARLARAPKYLSCPELARTRARVVLGPKPATARGAQWLVTRRWLPVRHGSDASPLGIVEIEVEALPDCHVRDRIVMKVAGVTEQEPAAFTVHEDLLALLNGTRDCHGVAPRSLISSPEPDSSGQGYRASRSRRW